MKILGIDPGQRHVGVCINEKGRKPLFHEIYTGDLPMLESKVKILYELRDFVNTHVAEFGPIEGLAIEKQLSVGGQSSSLMFYMMMTIFEALHLHKQAHLGAAQKYRIVSPLPIQLVSYMKKRHKVSTENATSIVESFREQFQWKERISQHKVDAFYLTCLANDVFEGNFAYTQPSREARIFSGIIEYGKQVSR